jgi:hypothetical protein
MSHLFESGVFTKGETAWHGLGLVLDGACSVREGFSLAKADWRVLESPVYDADMAPIDGFKQLKRSDNGFSFGIRSETYKIIQNEELMRVAEAFEHVAPLSALCVLDEGKKVTFASEIIGQQADILPGDSIKSYLVGVTSHDASVAFQVMFSPVRVVCQNTLSQALGLAQKSDKNKRLKVRHTLNSQQLIDRIPDILDVQNQKFTAGINELRAMARKPCNMAEFRGYISTVFASQLMGTINEVRGDDTTARPKILEDLPLWEIIQNKFEGGLIGGDISGVGGTFWAAYNSVTEFLTHDVGTAKNKMKAQSDRLEALYWGKSAELLNSAHNLALTATLA